MEYIVFLFAFLFLLLLFWILNLYKKDKFRRNVCELYRKVDVMGINCVEVQEYDIGWTPNEFKFVNELLADFTNYYSRQYLLGNLTLSWKRALMPHKAFFYTSLYSFLDDRVYDPYYKDYQLYATISRKNYGSWGTQNYDSECELTEYGICMQRVYLATLINMRDTKYAGANIDRGIKATKEAIETGQISISVIS